MKAVIMAAGKGTRMHPLTLTRPKVLVKVAGKPFLYYLLRNLEKAGISEMAIITGYRRDSVKKFIEEYGFRIKIIEQKRQKGTGHAVKLAEEFVGGDNFIVVGGDNLWSPDDIKSIMVNDDKHYVCGLKHSNPEKYGVLIEKNGRLEGIIEKPKEFVGDNINTGLYKFTSSVFDALKKIKPSKRGEYELTDALRILSEQEHVVVKKISDYWKDLGTIDDIDPLGKFIETNRW